jgi:cell division septation protein DedD
VPLERGRYSVLVGSFRQPVEAERLMAELVEQGYQVRSSRAATATRGVWHQVFAGPYADVEAARQAEARIRRLPGYGDARLISR